MLQMLRPESAHQSLLELSGTGRGKRTSQISVLVFLDIKRRIERCVDREGGVKDYRINLARHHLSTQAVP